MRDWLNDAWSYSKFAYWLRNVPFNHPDSKVYSEANANAMLYHPFRYWLSTVAIDKLQDILYIPVDFIANIKYYIYNRWIDKTHQLSSPQLKIGQWHELDDRILYCVMDSFVDFCLNDLCQYSHSQFSSKEEALLNWFAEMSQPDEHNDYSKEVVEMQTIYQWWTTSRPIRPISSSTLSWYELSTQYDQEDDDMLTRLIKIRKSLWS